MVAIRGVPVRYFVLFLGLGSILFADLSLLEEESLLFRAEKIAKSYASQIAKAPPPALFPQTAACLKQSSVWFWADLSVKSLFQPDFWNLIQSLGVDGVDLHTEKVSSAAAQTIACFAGERGITLIGHPLMSASCIEPDFELAIRAYKSYPHLFHLIEIEKEDWKLLPKTGKGDLFSPVPMSSVQALKSQGYLEGRPETIYPNTRFSCWAATAPIAGADHKTRRWIFLQNPNSGVAALNWLDPTFASQRVASGETINALCRLEQSILCFEASPLLCRQMAGLSPSENAIESLALLTRKLGGFSALRLNAPIEESKGAPTDLLYDRFTRPAVLHALLTGDAEALRLIYRIFLQEELQPRSLIHELRPYSEAKCEWTEFLLNPKRNYKYYEERITGELLAERLLKENLYSLNQSPSPYTPPIAPLFGLCPASFDLSDLENHKDELQKAHLLAAFFYAMQPGVFSFSADDLRGAFGDDPMKGPGLYHPLPRQLKNQNSFASELQRILFARKEISLPQAELVDVIPTSRKGLILLLHRLPLTREYYLLAVNFSRSYVQETIQGAFLPGKWAINLITQLTETKLYGSDTLELKLEPLTGKALFFKTKPYSQ